MVKRVGVVGLDGVNGVIVRMEWIEREGCESGYVGGGRWRIEGMRG